VGREIKFRAWDKDSKLMLYKEFYDHNWYTTPKNDEDGCHTYSSMQYSDQYHKELMQFTGLKDKNGKEIYEGDIVRGFEKEAGFPPYDSTLPRAIEFRDGCWCFNANRYDEGDWIRFGFWTHSNKGKTTLKQLEVIGNIYENPKLLAP
jgi:uncharacterized phage protein (TIGR01671 family)